MLLHALASRLPPASAAARQHAASLKRAQGASRQVGEIPKAVSKSSYMRYHNMNPIFGSSSKKARAADPDHYLSTQSNMGWEMTLVAFMQFVLH